MLDQTPPRKRRGAPGRKASEAALTSAALALLRRDGILAGLNLREVADKAGLNRALLYHYFGSRQDLLRAAVLRDLGPRIEEVRAGSTLPFRPRMRQLLHTLLRQGEAIWLMALLVLDGRKPVPLMPLKEEFIARIRQEQAEGRLAPDLDQGAVAAIITALFYGYVLFRDEFARELDVPAADLDWRVDDMVERLLTALLPPGEDSEPADRTP